MKANELMVGDYLMHNGFPYRVIQVDGIVRDGWMIENGEEDCGEPIPITPEILEKNKFIKQDFDGWEYIHPDDSTFSYIGYRILWRTDYDNHLFIKKYKGSGTSATLQISDINFVHQLQHALKLCGIEKEIEL